MWVNLRPLTGANVLVAYFNSEAAMRMEAMDDAALREHTLALLSTMYAEATVRAATVLECLVSRWAADELACGAYSFVAVGATPLDRATIARPEPPLFFAGEATSYGSARGGEGGFPSTVYGAHLSGERAAKEAAKMLGLVAAKKNKKSRGKGRGGRAA